MEITRILFFHSDQKENNEQIRQIDIRNAGENYINHTFLNDFFPDVHQSIKQMAHRRKKGLRGEGTIYNPEWIFHQIDPVIKQNNPDLIVVHFGIVFKMFPKTVIQIFSIVKERYPQITIVIEISKYVTQIPDEIIPLLEEAFQLDTFFCNEEIVKILNKLMTIANCYDPRQIKPLASCPINLESRIQTNITKFQECGKEFINNPKNEKSIQQLRLLEKELIGYFWDHHPRHNQMLSDLHVYKNQVVNFNLICETIFERKTSEQKEFENDTGDLLLQLKQTYEKIVNSSAKKILTNYPNTPQNNRMKKTIIVLFSERENEIEDRLTLYTKQKKLADFQILPVFATDLITEEITPKQLYKNLSGYLRSNTQPMFVIHVGKILEKFPKVFKQTIIHLKRDYPDLNIGIDNWKKLGFNENERKLFDESKNMKEIIEILL